MQPGIEALLARVTRSPEGPIENPYAKVLGLEAKFAEGTHQLAVLEQEVENKTKEVRLVGGGYFDCAVSTIVAGLTVESPFPDTLTVTFDPQIFSATEPEPPRNIEARTVTPGIVVKPDRKDWLATELVDALASVYHEYSSPFFLADGLCRDAYQRGPEACITRLEDIIDLLGRNRQSSRYSDYPDYVKGLADVRQILVGVVQRLKDTSA